MKKAGITLFVLLIGLFLTPGVGSATWMNIADDTYTFLDEDGEYGAYVRAQVFAEEDPMSPFSDGVGTYYKYKYRYQVDNTGLTGSDDFSPIDDIGWLEFKGAPYLDFGTDSGTGDVAVSLTEGTKWDDDNLLNNFVFEKFQFDFSGGLQAGEISDWFWITSWFANAQLTELSDMGFTMPLAKLQDGGQTATGDITSDLLVPSGSAETAVPEPATLLLLGSGLLTVACLRRKRNKK
jgi:hypothetical protein